MYFFFMAYHYGLIKLSLFLASCNLTVSSADIIRKLNYFIYSKSRQPELHISSWHAISKYNISKKMLPLLESALLAKVVHKLGNLTLVCPQSIQTLSIYIYKLQRKKQGWKELYVYVKSAFFNAKKKNKEKQLVVRKFFCFVLH